MSLLDKLQARVAARPASPARAAVGLPATPPPPGAQDSVGAESAAKIATLIDRLRTQACIPESWLPPDEDGPRAVEGSHELDRIAALPRRPADWPHVPDLSPIYVHTPGPCNGGCKLCVSGAPVALNRVQSAALFEAVQENGALCPIGVGHGKTLIGLLLHDAMRATRTVLMVQPDLRDQLMDEDVPLYNRHFVLPHVELWDGVVRDGQVTVVSYSTLSSVKNADVLERINPDVLVCDEAHNFRHSASARSKRWRRFVDGHPACRHVEMSGSMATRSIKDATGLAAAALRARSPYPYKHYPTLQAWAGALDVPVDPDQPYNLDPGAIFEAFASPEDRAAVDRGEMTRTEAAQRGFGRRLAETPGVIATSDGGAGMSLEIHAYGPTNFTNTSAIPKEMRDAMQTVQDFWRTPDGEEELEDGAAIARVMKQLAAGFYYVWDWGPAGRDLEWLAARANWHVELRNVLSRSQAGLDSPLLVSRAVERGELDNGISLAWADWKAVKGRFNPTPPTRAIWVHDWFVDMTMGWVGDQRSKVVTDGPEEAGIVWMSHIPLMEKLRERGLRVYGSGDDSRAILAADPRAHLEYQVIGASIQAHGTGKNLQRYARNLVTTPPANGTKWEQLMGRTHRPGQRADVVKFDVNVHTPHLMAAFSKALDDAVFQQNVQGQRQKLLSARRFGL